jgi:hypothetical protein
MDSDSGERVIVYLTDVEDKSHGPIEFLSTGKLLGKAGTYAKYSASEVHRGCKSSIDRFALALAFDSNDSKALETIGAVVNCADFTCPAGYQKKNPLPTTGDGSTEICCEQVVANNDKNIGFKVAVVIICVLVVLALLARKYRDVRFPTGFVPIQ